MKVLRLLAFSAIASVALTAGATHFHFELAWSGGGREILVIEAEGPVTSITRVTWSYSFPGTGYGDSGVLTFYPGEQSHRFPLQYPDDGMYHPPLSGTCELSYEHDGKPVTRSGPLVIHYEVPWLSMESSRAVESDDEQTLGLRLSHASAIPIGFSIRASDGSARSGADFALIDEAVTFAPGQLEAQVRFKAFRDGAAEGEETFRIGAYIEAGPNWSAGLWSQAEITIDDAEIGAVLDPPATDVYNGDRFDLSLTLGRPLHATRPVTVSIGSSNGNVAVPLQEAMPIAAGTTFLTIPIESRSEGAATITVSFPDELAMSPVTTEVRVFGGVFSFDRATMLLRRKEQSSVGVEMSPPPPVPMEVGAELSRGGVINLLAPAQIGAGGTGSISFVAVGLGTVEMALVNRGRESRLGVMTVRVIEAFSAKSIAPVTGSTSGGTAVTITGSGFAGDCAVSFNGIAAKNVTVVNETTLRAVTPARAAGVADVTVGCDSFVEQLPAAFTFQAPSKSRSVRH